MIISLYLVIYGCGMILCIGFDIMLRARAAESGFSGRR